MNKVIIIVGLEQDKEGRRIPDEARALKLDQARFEALTLADGVTITEGSGSWVSPVSRELVSERVARIEVAGEFAREDAVQVARAIRDLFWQECVTFEFTAGIDFELV